MSLQMERISSLQQKNCSYLVMRSVYYMSRYCSRQVVRGTSELLRGKVYEAARPRSRAA